MKRFKFLIALLCAIFLFWPVETVFGSSDVLEPNEAASLSYLREFAKLKRDIYDSSAYFCTYATEEVCSPLFLSLAAEERRHMNQLKELIDFFGLEDPAANDVAFEYSDGFIDDELEMTIWVGWMVRYSMIVQNAAYLGEINIRDLALAISETNEETLVATYTELQADAYIHLLKLASVLYENPLDYSAQVLSSDEVEQILGQALDLTANFEINAGLNDAWYEPATNGQGFFLSVFPDKGTVMLGWFTFDMDFPGQEAIASLGDPCQRWLTAQGPYEGDQADLVVYNSSGGLFDSELAVPHLEPIGSITLRFENCESGTVNYDLPTYGLTGEIPIQRVASDNIADCVVRAYPIK